MKASHQLPKTALPRPRLTGRALLLALVLGGGAAAPVLAQQVPAPAAADSTGQVVDLLPAATADSLAAAPLTPAPVDSARLLWLQTPATLYEIVNDRMGCLESDMPHQFNEAVLAYVRLFTERQRGYTQRVLEREQLYFPLFEKYLAQYKLPLDLKYLSVVESALIPTAKSRVGAVGLWQFMPPTASDLRLKRDEWVDERMHPEKATEAACKHLRYLYGLFHDWELVLAAYNWGAGNVHRVMRRTGKKTFWELYPHLPAETRNYVPTFTAVLYAMRYAPDYHLHDAALRYQRAEVLDTLTLTGQPLDLRRLSRALGYADSTALGRYNPEVRRGGLPAGYRPYVLRYPAAAAREHLGEVDRATLLAYCQPVSELPQPLTARLVYPAGYVPPTSTALAGSPDAAAAPRFRRQYYTVRRGQTLAAVAERLAVTPAQLRRWNNMGPNSPLRPGRQLVAFKPLPPAAEAVPVALATAAAAPLAPTRAITAADSAARELAAANTRYAREALAATQREADQQQSLKRLQRQQAARLVAEQRAAARRTAALTQAAAAEEKRRRQALADAEPADAPAGDATATAADVADAQLPDTPNLAIPRPDSLTPAPRPGRARARAKALAGTEAGDEAAQQLAARSTIRHPRTVEDASPSNLREAGEVKPGRVTRETKAAPVAKAAPTLNAPVTSRPAAPTSYVVQAGDNLTRIARDNGVSVAQLREWNGLPDDGTVQAGQRLRLTAAPAAEAPATPARTLASRPGPLKVPATHVVQPGDTLYNISKRFKLSVDELRRLNHLTSDDVKLGQKLVVQAQAS